MVKQAEAAGAEFYNHGICPKGASGMFNTYDPYRLKKPLKRTNPKKGPNEDPRWVEIPWEEALSTITARLAKIKADPRMQPVTVYEILEINFPVDSPDLLTARAADTQQFASKFKGCGSAKSAASGIFNVKVGKKIEADSRRIPPQLQAAFKQAGVGAAIGPFRNQNGLQMWGYCGTKKVTPQMPKAQLPTRDQVKTALLNEKFDAIEKKYGVLLRKNLMIEYRDPAYGN